MGDSIILEGFIDLMLTFLIYKISPFLAGIIFCLITLAIIISHFDIGISTNDCDECIYRKNYEEED